MYDARPPLRPGDQQVERLLVQDACAQRPVEQAQRMRPVEKECGVDDARSDCPRADVAEHHDLVGLHRPLPDDDERTVDRPARQIELACAARLTADDGDIDLVFIPWKSLCSVCTRSRPPDKTCIPPMSQ